MIKEDLRRCRRSAIKLFLHKVFDQQHELKTFEYLKEMPHFLAVLEQLSESMPGKAFCKEKYGKL